MELKTILTKHREYYLNHFKKIRDQSESGVNEFLLEIKNDEPEELYRLYRYDLVIKKEDDFSRVEYNSDGFQNHSEIEFDINSKKIILRPIVWNGIEVSIDLIDFKFDGVEEWAFKWLDIEDKKEINKDKFQEVIHNITKPAIEDNWLTFCIDFGTSNIEAAEELIEIILKQENVKEIIFESKWMTGE